MSRSLRLLVSLSLLATLPLAAQGTAEEPKDEYVRGLRRRALLYWDPLNTTRLSGAQTSLTFSGSIANAKAVAKFGVQGQTVGFTAAISAPLRDDTTAVFAEFDPLQHHATVSATFNTLPGRFDKFGRLVYSIGLEVGRKSFKFANGPGGPDQEVNRTPFYLMVASGRSFGDRFFLGGTFSYARGYAAGGQVQVCEPVPGGPLLVCEPAIIAGPSEKTASVLGSTFRYADGRCRFELRLTRDFETDATGIQIPVAVAPDPAQAFAVGLRFSWESITEKIRVQAIATLPFGSKAGGGLTNHDAVMRRSGR